MKPKTILEFRVKPNLAEKAPLSSHYGNFGKDAVLLVSHPSAIAHRPLEGEAKFDGVHAFGVDEYTKHVEKMGMTPVEPSWLGTVRKIHLNSHAVSFTHDRMSFVPDHSLQEVIVRDHLQSHSLIGLIDENGNYVPENEDRLRKFAEELERVIEDNGRAAFVEHLHSDRAAQRVNWSKISEIMSEYNFALYGRDRKPQPDNGDVAKELIFVHHKK